MGSELTRRTASDEDGSSSYPNSSVLLLKTAQWFVTAHFIPVHEMCLCKRRHYFLKHRLSTSGNNAITAE